MSEIRRLLVLGVLKNPKIEVTLSRVCNGSFTLQPDARTTIRFGDPVEGVGNSEHIVVSCGGRE